MEFHRTVIIAPRLDFLRFFKEGLLTDCEIQIRSMESDAVESIKAHRAVLANSSQFFYNTFTSGMIEAKTGIVEITNNPNGLLPRVIEFLYSGDIQIQEGQEMSLLSIGHNLGINSLVSAVMSYVNNLSSTDKILNLIDQCFNMELINELPLLVPTIARHYSDFGITRLTQALDVQTFLQVLEKVPLTGETKANHLIEFVGDYKCEACEKEAIAKFFADLNDPAALALMRQKGGSLMGNA